jgi:phosphoglucosamine mutase
VRTYFGTDGVRGVANTELPPELVTRLARAGAYVLCGGAPAGRSIVIGRDPRISGPMLEAAAIAGVTSAGLDALSIGVIPTPGVALVTRELQSLGAAGGIMISASHNPIQDNGIKFFGSDGFKLDDEREHEIEHLLQNDTIPRPTSTNVGTQRSIEHEQRRYFEALIAAGADLSDLTIAVDFAHGAAYRMAKEALEALGARLIYLNDEPDGALINVRCGATHLEPLRAAVLAHNARAEGRPAVGVAFDGDADRALFIDETGATVTGDHVLWLLANEKKLNGSLGEAVVGTSMTNIGLENALSQAGIGLVRAAVGDRYVIDAMRSRGLRLGAEASGHVVDFDRGTTGDGPMTAIAVFSLLSRAPSLHELASVVRIAPQLIRNVPSTRGQGILDEPSVREAVEREVAQLGSDGRIVVRPSGTEPVVRVMVEAPEQALVEEIASRICLAIQHVNAASV